MYDEPHNEPTEKAPIEPTQYPSVQYPIYPSIPEIPPPPPRKRSKKGLFIALAVSLIVSLVAVALFLLYTYESKQPYHAISETPVVGITMAPAGTPTHAITAGPTTAPTIIIETPTSAPPTQTVMRYTASDIVRDFIQAGIPIVGSADGTGIHVDNKWEGYSYVPEGGAYYWLDGAAGTNVDIAVFATQDEAITDGEETQSRGFSVSWVGGCMLSFNNNFPQFEYDRYWQVMQQVC